MFKNIAMDISKDTIEKYLDIVLNELDKINMFSVNNTLAEKHIPITTSKQKDDFEKIVIPVIYLGKELGFFKSLSKDNSWFKLSEKGIKAHELGGYFKYLEYRDGLKSNETKLSLNVENFIGGDNLGLQSSDSEIIKPKMQNIKKQNAPNKPTKSVLKTIYWILGILVAITILITFIIQVF
jgi:hypothetical protein